MSSWPQLHLRVNDYYRCRFPGQLREIFPVGSLNRRCADNWVSYIPTPELEDEGSGGINTKELLHSYLKKGVNKMMGQRRNIFLIAVLASLNFAVTGCSGGGSSSSSPAPTPGPTPTPIVGSSGSSSGSTGVYTNNGASYALTPATGAAAAGSAKLLTLPNTGSSVAALTVPSVSATPIATTLGTVINGTSVDPAHDVGMAYSYTNNKISIFGLTSKAEISTHDTLTVNTLSFSGGLAKIPGAIMNPANQTIILATADGFEVVDYSNPAAPAKVREIPSLTVSPTAGVEINENFGFDPKLPIAGTNHAMILTGGRYSYSLADPILTIVDSETGKVYKPDAATGALFTVSQYIDAIAVDTTYHVAVLADESTGTTFVDLNRLTLDATAGTYTLPAAAVSRITTYYKMDNLGIESTRHLVMMGQGFGGSSMVVGQLKDPAIGLGFSKEAVITMPVGTDNNGAQIYWSGSYDPHGTGAYITDSAHPTYTTQTALGLWVNGTGSHIAIIDLQGVLDGTLAGGAYNPTATNPKDIAYFAIP